MDWEDIALHFVGALAIQVLIVSLAGTGSMAYILAAAHAAVWFVREVWQDWRKDNRPLWPIRYSSQKWAEFIAPVIAIAIVMALAEATEGVRMALHE